MILTVTPNPLLDYVLHRPEPLSSGGQRLRRIEWTVGGKGINVARMLKTLGRPGIAISFAGGPNGEKIREGLKQQGLSAILVPTTAETRVGVNLVVDSPRSQSWWIETGEDLLEREVLDLLEVVSREIGRARFLALSGTIPGNGNQDLYRRIIERTGSFPGEIWIDARGEALNRALGTGKCFLKHNREESRETFGCDPFEAHERVRWASRLAEAGVVAAVVTDGPGRVLVWTGGEAVVMAPPHVDEVSAVGSGDATLAGILYGRSQGLDLIESVRWGLASGAADACYPGPCQAPFAAVEKLLSRVRIEAVAEKITVFPPR